MKMILYFHDHPPTESDVLKCVCGSLDIVVDRTQLSSGRTGCVCKRCLCGFEMAYAPQMIDPKNHTFEQVEALLKDQPTTFIPALLIALTKAGYEKSVFAPSGASRIVRSVEEKHGWDLK